MRRFSKYCEICNSINGTALVLEIKNIKQLTDVNYTECLNAYNKHQSIFDRASALLVKK